MLLLRTATTFLTRTIASSSSGGGGGGSMPKEAAHVPAAQRQRAKIKERAAKHAPSRVTLQVLGTGAEGAPRSLYVFSDQARYLFNCGEGTQRLAHEHKMKLSRLEHIFITQATWRNLGGLPGTALTIQDVGVPEISLHGPPGLADLFTATQRFVVMKNMRVTTMPCAPCAPFEDSVMQVTYVPLTRPAHAARDDDEEITASTSKSMREALVCRRVSSGSLRASSLSLDTTDYYSHEQRAKGERRSGMPRAKLGDAAAAAFTVGQLAEQKQRGNVMAYACRLRSRPGMLNLDKCVELCVPAGPLLGQLKNGIAVTLADGRVITPAEVCEPDEPGPVFLVVECPHEDYIPGIAGAAPLNEHLQLGRHDNAACVVVHFTPAHVANLMRYQEWIDTFPLSTQHLFINDSNKCMGSVAVHRIQHKLNLLSKTMFPLLGDQGTPCRGGGDDDGRTASTMCAARYMQPGTFYNFHLRPRHGMDVAAEIRLTPADYVEETYAVEGFCDELTALRREIIGAQKTLRVRDYPRVLFLGTGSCIPNKTRNTSGILLMTADDANALLDCGEGTYGQVVRFFGEPAALKHIAATEAIYISHLHADHHIGLVGYLQGRRRARRLLGLPPKPVFLLAPKQIQTWLGFYDLSFEDIYREYYLIPNADLLAGDGVTVLDDALRTELLAALRIDDVRTCRVQHCPNAFGVTLRHRNGFRVTYSGDTMPSEELVRLGAGSDLLIHEATMEDELHAEAAIKMHSTTSQAIKIGQRMHARAIILTHFSQRYAKLPRFNSNFTANVGIAFDNMLLRCDELPLVPLLYSALRLMFAEQYDEMEQKTAKRSRREERLSL